MKLLIPVICKCGFSTMDAKKAVEHARKHEMEIPAFISTIWHKEGDGLAYLKFRCPACKQRYRLKDIDEIDSK